MKLDKSLFENLIKETAHIESFQKQLGEAKTRLGESCVTIAVVNGNEIEKRVLGCSEVRKSTLMGGKCDIEVVNESGEPNFYIAHKDGTLPKHFLQYGGVSERTSESIAKHPEVKAFVEAIKRQLQKEGKSSHPNGIKFMREIRDERLKEMALFGSEFDLDSSGPNNVDAIIQGDIRLEHLGGPFYALRANSIMLKESLRSNSISAIIESKMGSEYEPVLLSRYDSGRNNFGIETCRIGIFPREGKIYSHKVGFNGQVYKIK